MPEFARRKFVLTSLATLAAPRLGRVETLASIGARNITLGRLQSTSSWNGSINGRYRLMSAS